MVKTSDDVMGITPLERMDKLSDISAEKKNTIAFKRKELEELQSKKKEELEELDKLRQKQLEEIDSKKKKELDELDKKKKELEDLEKKKAEEIEETEQLIEKSFQELMRHKRLIIAQEEEDESKKKNQNQTASENLEAIAGTAKELNVKNVDYSKFFENLQTPRNLYDIANTGFYHNLNELKDKAARGEITPEEERFVNQLRNQFEQMNENQYNRNKDEFNYLQRSISVLDQIDQYKTRR